RPQQARDIGIAERIISSGRNHSSWSFTRFVRVELRLSRRREGKRLFAPLRHGAAARPTSSAPLQPNSAEVVRVMRRTCRRISTALAPLCRRYGDENDRCQKQDGDRTDDTVSHGSGSFAVYRSSTAIFGVASFPLMSTLQVPIHDPTGAPDLAG